jgi:hypothetical protein
MPNIEIHGMGVMVQAHEMKKRIFQLFSDKPYVEEMVVTIFSTKVRNKCGDSQPFLRLVNSCQEHAEEIITILRRLNMDIEYLELKAFYPKGPSEGLSP